MVQLEEVPDDELHARQPGKGEDSDWESDTESDISDVDSEDGLDETLLDRLTALKDIVPPTYRKRIADASATGYRWSAKALSMGGSTLWIVSTSALLLGVPWALAFGEEQQVQEMEKEMRMQQSANELLTPGSGGAKPAL